MSWLARSIAKTLLPSDEEEDEEVERVSEGVGDGDSVTNRDNNEDPLSPTKGVKEDISELTKTLTRQFRGFASFLAPPPQEESESREVDEDDDVDASDSPRALSGFRSDLAEIGGKVRSGISILSEHVAVSEIAKIASSFLPLGSDEDADSTANGVVTVSEEVMVFVENISMHPETWLDFPLLFDDDDDYDDFELTDAQEEHAYRIEEVVPRLAALRIELCPAHMSENCFWFVYFLLLVPTLSPQHAQLLSSPQIVEARAKLSSKSPNQTKIETKEIINSSEIPIEVPDKSPEIMKMPLEYKSEEEPSSKDIHALPSSSNKNKEENETLTLTTIPVSDDKHPVVVNEVKIVDKSVIKEEGIQIQIQKFESEETDDADDEWLQEEDNNDNNNINNNIGLSQSVPLGDEEDVSFSDLEEEDEEKK